MYFKNITNEDYLIINQRLKNKNYNGCEFSKLYLSAWDFFNYETMQISIEDEYVFMRFKPRQEFFDEIVDFNYIYLPPICDKTLFSSSIKILDEFAKSENDKLFVTSLSREFIDILGNCDYKFIGERDFDDYLYNPQDLISFSGKKYHGKRNHIANFDKKYKYNFRKYNMEDRTSILNLFDAWHDKKVEDKKLGKNEEAELKALNISLDLLEVEENLFGYVLEVDNKIIGFSLVEITPSNIAIEHVEKANIEYEGVYPKLLNLTAKEAFSNVRYVNRQEDMGIEGLRKSKLSYHPTRMNEKFYLTIR